MELAALSSEEMQRFLARLVHADETPVLACPHIDFADDRAGQQFKATLKRGVR